MRQNYTWADSNGTCVKNNNGAAVCDSTCPNATAQGGCAYCSTNPSSKPGCPGYVAPYVAPACEVFEYTGEKCSEKYDQYWNQVNPENKSCPSGQDCSWNQWTYSGACYKYHPECRR
jgi:hypothetical protein